MISTETYFSKENNMHYISVSQFKAFESCEASALAELNGEYQREKTVSLLVGSYVDAHFEGTLDTFKAQNPEIFKRNGGLKSEYTQAEYIIKRIERDEMFMAYMSGQKQVIFTGEIADVPVKIKVDSYNVGRSIVDLKIMKDFKPIYKPEMGRLSFIEAWGYDYQGAVYQEIVRQNTGERLPFFIAAATKEKEPDIGIFQIEQPALDVALEIFTANMPQYDALKRGIVGDPIRCEKCDYCKRTKVLSKIITMEELNND